MSAYRTAAPQLEPAEPTTTVITYRVVAARRSLNEVAVEVLEHVLSTLERGHAEPLSADALDFVQSLARFDCFDWLFTADPNVLRDMIDKVHPRWTTSPWLVFYELDRASRRRT